MFKVILFFSSIALYSQNYVIQYNQYYDGLISSKTPTNLYINLTSNFSIYEIETSKTSKIVTGKEYIDEEVVLDFVKKAEKKLSVYDLKSRTKFSKQFIGNIKFETIDILPILNWKILGNKKNVMGYEVVKAECEFRGRKWIAWFAPDLPISVGPVFFHDLPGVVFEIYDENQIFKIIASKISTSSDSFDSVLELYKNQNEDKDIKRITLKEFILKTEELNNSLEANTGVDRNSKMSILKIPRNGFELKYEWEE